MICKLQEYYFTEHSVKNSRKYTNERFNGFRKGSMYDDVFTIANRRKE